MTANPWYSPEQLAVALGITLPLFLYFAYRIYTQVLDHHQALDRLSKPEGLRAMIERRGIAGDGDPIARELALAEVFGELDREIGSRRRTLRGDAQVLVLVGFFGTLIGVMGAFGVLLAQRGGGASPFELVQAIVGGGLATALVSSLVAAVLSALVLTYLAGTEQRVSKLRHSLVAACRVFIERAPKESCDGLPTE